MSKKEVMSYIRKEYNSTILPYFQNHLALYRIKIFPVCQRGQKKSVTLPWENIMSKNRTKFRMQVFGDKKIIDTLTIGEFDWQGQHCFLYIKHNLMIVFSEHALRRYEERVYGKKDITKDEIEELFMVLIKYMHLSYHTILPSPTHPLCYYFVVLSGLFLGDFDETNFRADQNEGKIWLNTCISLKEAKETQKGILNTLSLMPYFIKFIGFNPFDTDVLISHDKAYSLKPENKNWSSVQCLCKSVYLIDKLFLMMDLPVSDWVKDLFYKEMKYAESLLVMGGTDVSKLTPYGRNGIAIRGELDYKGEA